MLGSRCSVRTEDVTDFKRESEQGIVLSSILYIFCPAILIVSSLTGIKENTKKPFACDGVETHIRKATQEENKTAIWDALCPNCIYIWPLFLFPFPSCWSLVSSELLSVSSNCVITVTTTDLGMSGLPWSTLAYTWIFITGQEKNQTNLSVSLLSTSFFWRMLTNHPFLSFLLPQRSKRLEKTQTPPEAER